MDLADDVSALAESIDAPPLGTSLLPGYIESEPHLFHGSGWRAAGLGLRDIGIDVLGVVTAMVVTSEAQVLLHGYGRATALWSAFGRLALCLPVLLLVLAPSRHRLRMRLQTTVGQQLREVGLPMAGGTLVCIALWRVVAAGLALDKPPEDALLLSWLISAFAVALLRSGRHAPSRRDGTKLRRAVVVGSGVVAQRVASQLQPDAGVLVVGFVDDDPLDPSRCLGNLSELAEVCAKESIDHVVVAFSRASDESMAQALRAVQGRLPISVVPRLFDVIPATAGAHDLASGYPAISVAPATLGLWPRAVKRTADVFGAAVCLIVAAPILLVAAIGVRLSSPGSILLRQPRVGYNGREFTVWKFRTFTVMESVPPPEVLGGGERVTGPFPKLKVDPRTTRFGKILRRLSIDELPQLLNVLNGTMSLVGPRPLQPEFAWSFGNWALRRYAVKPGLTGLWQVSGRNDLTYEEMCRLDHLYVTSWSVGLDMRILARTARAVLGGRGCY